MRARTILVAAVSVLVAFGCEQKTRDDVPQVDLEELVTDQPVEREILSQPIRQMPR